MGHVVQVVTLSADKSVTASMLVDTGATYSVIPRAMARALGLRYHKHTVPIRLADGRPMKTRAALALFRIGDREAPSTILVGDVAEPILGVEALEVLGLTVDPRNGRLRPTRGYAARMGGSPVLSWGWTAPSRDRSRRNQRATVRRSNTPSSVTTSSSRHASASTRPQASAGSTAPARPRNFSSTS